MSFRSDVLRGRRGLRPSRLRYYRTLAVERLECRRLLDATPIRGEALANDATIGDQSIRDAVAAVARTPVSTIIAYSGRGPGDRDGVFIKRYNAENSVQGPPALVNQSVNGYQGAAAVAGDEDGNFVVVWEGEGIGDERGIFLRRYNAAGEPLGGETLVNTTVGGGQNRPAVAMGPDGRFVVAWSGVGAGDLSGVFVRRYNPDGSPSGTEVLVNTHVVGQQDYAAAAIDDDGQFIVAWSSRHQDGADWGVYAQRFAANGAKNGSEIAVNAVIANSQIKPSIAYLANGSAFVAFNSRGQDGDGWSVFGRTIDAAGALGAETRLSTTTAGHQREVAVAATPQAGEVFAVWQTGTANGAGWEIRARVVVLASSTVNAEITVNAARGGANSGQQRFPDIATNAAGDAVIAWMGEGLLDRDGVYLRRYQTNTSIVNVAPVIADIPDQEATLGEVLVVEVSAFDANTASFLTYTLDATVSPAGASIAKTTNNTATIRWTPTVSDLPGPATFRVVVTDDGSPALSDTEEFLVELIARSAAAARAGDESADALAALDSAYALLNAQRFV